MKAREKPAPQPRYDRELWLETALNMLAREGGARLRVEGLARSLGVTKGSFYHHFRDRQDFVNSLISYWSEGFTDSVIAVVNDSHGSPSDRLWALTRHIETEGLDRFDNAFRSWAAQDVMVAELIREVDLKRHAFVRGLFEDLGFSGAELDMRVKVWLVFASARRTVYTPEDQASANTELELRHAFFTQPAT